MKKITLLCILLFCVSVSTNAQKQEKRGERNAKIKALKIPFLTEKLDLQPKEAEKFWPIYNLYDGKLHQLERVEKHKLLSKIRLAGGMKSISEDEAKLIYTKTKDIDNKILATKIAFDKELIKVLSYKKILKLKTAEKDFVRTLMRKYRKKKN